MLIVDSQVHLWSGGKPAAHHRQTASFSKDELLAGMAAAGVDRAVIVPPSWDSDGHSVAIEAARAHPDRFAIMARIAIDDPESRTLVDAWKSQVGMLGFRQMFSTPETIRWLEDGTADWWWAAAERAKLPVMMLPRGSLHLVSGIAERYPELRLVIDHMAVPQGPMDAAAFEHLPQLLALARHPNVAVKASGLPGYTTDPYPFRNLHEPIRRAFDAFGPRRLFWGTDLTRMPCSYRQCVTLFTEALPWLAGTDLELVMGRAVCEWIGWRD